jgi:transposase
VFFLLESEGLDCVLYHAAQVKALPGRPKTDLLDSVWLAKITERGALPGSFVPPEDIRRLRTHTRYRRHLTQARTAEKARVEKLLEDGIKIDSVSSSIATKSGRAMIEALIDGVRRGPVLAQLARGKMRAKIPDLSMALEGRFGDHHALMCRLHLDHIDHLEAMLARLDAQIEAMMTLFQCWRDLLTTAPGIGPLSAAAVISEIGVTVREFFPDDARLASWTGLCPGNHESAGRRRSGRRRKGNEHLQSILVECAWAAVRHDGYLKSLYHRGVMKWGGYRSHGPVKLIWPHLLRPAARPPRRKPSSWSPTPWSSSSGTSWPPGSPTTNWAPATSPAAWTPNGRPAASSPGSKPSATASPSTRPPDTARRQALTDGHQPGSASACPARTIHVLAEGAAAPQPQNPGST